MVNFNTKISYRFFDDKPLRAIWDEENSKWYFSAKDFVNVLNIHEEASESDNIGSYFKDNRNSKIRDKNNSFSKVKNFISYEEKYFSNLLDYDEIIKAVKKIPGKSSSRFLDWFLSYDESIDGRSKNKAYALFESLDIEAIEVGTTRGLQAIHMYLFEGLYDFAGQIRQLNISKGGFPFAMAMYLDKTLEKIDKMPERTYDEIIEKYIEMNIAHPFMDGNGRATRIWLDLMLKLRMQRCVDWSQVGKSSYMNAMFLSPTQSTPLKNLLYSSLTDKIHCLQTYRRGIDYSYYYEEY